MLLRVRLGNRVGVGVVDGLGLGSKQGYDNEMELEAKKENPIHNSRLPHIKRLIIKASCVRKKT